MRAGEGDKVGYDMGWGSLYKVQNGLTLFLTTKIALEATQF